MEDLDEPRTLDCLMIKAPLKKVQKNYTTVIFMWFLMLLVYITCLLFIFPRKSLLLNPSALSVSKQSNHDYYVIVDAGVYIFDTCDHYV